VSGIHLKLAPEIPDGLPQVMYSMINAAHAPHRAEDRFASECLAGALGEYAQDLVRLRREMDFLTARTDATMQQVDFEIAGHELCRLALLSCSSAQSVSDPRQELSGTKGLPDIVGEQRERPVSDTLGLSALI
jgi:hypothetical protein